MQPRTTSYRMDALPKNTELTLTADLVRIKFLHNSVYGLVCQAMEISPDKFQLLWQDKSGALIRIGGHISDGQKKLNGRRLLINN